MWKRAKDRYAAVVKWCHEPVCMRGWLARLEIKDSHRTLKVLQVCSLFLRRGSIHCTIRKSYQRWPSSFSASHLLYIFAAVVIRCKIISHVKFSCLVTTTNFLPAWRPWSAQLVLRLLCICCVCLCVHPQLSHALSHIILLLCNYSHKRSGSYWKFAGSIGQGTSS